MQAREKIRKTMATVFTENGLADKVDGDGQQHNSKEEQTEEESNLLLQDPFRLL